ncbi:MAG TPA: DNA-3-methyladenine glycosylase 2 family protein [Candidatus Dormibacteraeota bacterium]|nr:DNA-3-methyladenine glycosylase 2 family protein [Candidatus Dormibacteraeota bacterium]
MKTSTAQRTFEIQPLGPYSLAESANFIGAWHEAPSDSGAAPGHVHLAFLTDEAWRPAGVCITQDESGLVRGEVFGSAGVDAVERQVARILSLDVDGRGWPEVGRRDRVVGLLQRRFPGFRPVNWSDAYEAAAWCLMSTRINMRQAQGVKDRMCRELGHEVDVHGHRLWAFPEPSRLAALESFPGLFSRKVEYLNRMGRAALQGDLDTEMLRALPREESLERLRRLAGIGEFGSQLVRLRALSAVDELPTREPRLMGAIRTEYSLESEPNLDELEALAERWRPYRMWVAVCLRRSLAGGAGMMHSHASG